MYNDWGDSSRVGSEVRNQLLWGTAQRDGDPRGSSGRRSKCAAIDKFQPIRDQLRLRKLDCGNDKHRRFSWFTKLLTLFKGSLTLAGTENLGAPPQCSPQRYRSSAPSLCCRERNDQAPTHGPSSPTVPT